MAPKGTKRKGGDEPSTTKKAKASKKDEELPTFDDRWKTQKPSLIYIGDDLEGGSKIAALDMDGTLIERRKEYINTVVSYDVDSWQWYDDNVPKKLKELHKDGYKLVIFTNQSPIKSALEGKGATKLKAKIDSVIKAAGVPIAVVCATQKDENRKPETGMWEFFTKECNGGVKVDLKASFFVGDAAGREYDIADTDKEFAKNVGLKFHTPEEFFGPGKRPNKAMANCLEKYSDKVRASDADKAVFRAAALRKAAHALLAHEEKIESGKEAMKLSGVGKGSCGLIDEYLQTGVMGAEDEDQEGAEKKEAEPSKQAKAALAFV